MTSNGRSYFSTRRAVCVTAVVGTLSVLSCSLVMAQEQVRARDLGIPFEGKTGRYNAITDVPGTEVGHATVIEGEGKLVIGEGPVRIGLTATFPRGNSSDNGYFAASYALNGHGELTGTSWLQELGTYEGPILYTDGKAIGTVYDAVLRWEFDRGVAVGIPIVGETSSAFLNDNKGFHLSKEHVYQALDDAQSGPVAEGNVGGGTPMICHGWKGGIGTSSRIIEIDEKIYTVGVLVQCNYGLAGDLTIAGRPVGKLIQLPKDHFDASFVANDVINTGGEKFASSQILIGTDAPLMPFQLKRLAKRAASGMARVGAVWQHGSGDFAIAYSTANENYFESHYVTDLALLPTYKMAPLLKAAVLATEEAIVNSMITAETMVGKNNRKVYALPHDEVRKVFQHRN